MGYLYTPRYCYISPLCFTARRKPQVRDQSLSRQQVESYIEQAGESLAGLRTALQHDENLGELLNTPLMLSLAVLAYKGRSADDIHALGTLEEHRVQFFAAYTDAMFHRRAKAAPYTREQTEHWLTWLAKTMQDHNQSIFYLEWMGSSPLNRGKARL